MKRPDDPNERMFIMLMIALIVIGWVQQNMRQDVLLLDARVTNIEAAK